MSRQLLLSERRARWRTAVLAMLLCFGVTALPAAAREEEEYTKEWGASLGLNSLLDDTNSSIVGNLHGSMGASVRFLFNPRMALRTEMGVHFIGGDTGGVKDFYPDYVDQVGTARRFYRHSGTIFDLAALYELNFFSYAYRPGYQGHRRFTPYLQMGLGFAFSTTGRSVGAPRLWREIQTPTSTQRRPRLDHALLALRPTRRIRRTARIEKRFLQKSRSSRTPTGDPHLRLFAAVPHL